jgi:hypothetical protein
MGEAGIEGRNFQLLEKDRNKGDVDRDHTQEHVKVSGSDLDPADFQLDECGDIEIPYQNHMLVNAT